MARLLITGGEGYIGGNLARLCAGAHTVVTTALPALAGDAHLPLDITDLDSTCALLERVRPDAVIHCAGLKDVRQCQQQAALAQTVNADGTRHVAQACDRSGAQLVLLSTDLVFDGTRGNYREDETPAPTLIYSVTKLLAEHYARESTNRLAICRTGGVYGANSPLLQWLAAQLRAGQTVECFTDVYNTPTLVDNLSAMLVRVIEQRLTGVFHTVGSQRVNRYELFCAFARQHGFDPAQLVPMAAGARRDAMCLLPDSSLNNAVTTARLGITGLTPDAGMAQLRATKEFL